MAYGLRLRIEYNDINDVLTQVNIYQDGYSGSADVRYANAGLKIQWGDESNPDPLIYGSSCTLFFDAEFDYEFLYLFSSDAKKHKVEVKKGGSVFWLGLIEPDSWSEPMHATPYPVQCTAYDGLGFLRDVKYQVHEGVRTSIDSIMQAIVDEIGLSLPLYWSLSFAEEGANEYQTHLVDDTIYDGLSCYEVLEQLFQGYMIYQRLGNLYFWCMGYAGDFTPTIEDVAFENTPVLRILPGLKKLSVIYDLGYRKNLALNGGFEKFNAALAEFTGWNNTGVTPQQKILNTDGDKYVFIPGTQTTDYIQYYMMKSMAVVETTSIVNFTIGYAIQGSKSSAYPLIAIVLRTSTSYYYLNPKALTSKNLEFEWVEVPLATALEGLAASLHMEKTNSTIVEDGETVPAYAPAADRVAAVSASKITDSFEKFRATVTGLPATGTLEIYLSKPMVSVGETKIDGACFAGVAVELLDESSQEFPTEIKFDVTGDLKNNYVPDEIKLLNGDYQSEIDNHKLIYKGGFTRPEAGEPETTGWKLGGSVYYPYCEFIGRLLAARMLHPRQQMSARIMDVVPPPIVVFTDANNPGKTFIETGITYDDRYQSIEGSFTEINALDIDDPDTDGDTSYAFDEILLPDIRVPDPINREDRIKIIDRNGAQLSRPSQLYENDFEVREPVSGEADDGKGRIQIKREGIAPYNLRRDSATLQFSLSSAVTGNVSGNPAIAAISAGKLVSHNWNAQDKDNQLKSAETSYDPEREWDITGASIEFTTTAMHWLYIKAPVDELETDAELVAGEDHIDPLFEDGFVYYKIGYAGAVTGGQREIRTLWGGGGGGTTQVQTDWNQTDAGAVDFIKNKPTSLGATTYKALTDTSDDSFTGKDLHVPMVDEANDELDLTPTELATFFSLDDFDETTYTGKNDYYMKCNESTGKIKLAALPAIPVKASAAELNTGTDDAKFATAKGLKDAEFARIHVGTSPPSDTTMLWLDTN